MLLMHLMERNEKMLDQERSEHLHTTLHLTSQHDARQHENNEELLQLQIVYF